MPRYSREFQEHAVELVRSSGRSLHSISQELGVSWNALKEWCQKEQTKGGSHGADPAQELRELRKRVRRLEMEREILKKAAAFFAKENG